MNEQPVTSIVVPHTERPYCTEAREFHFWRFVGSIDGVITLHCQCVGCRGEAVLVFPWAKAPREGGRR